MGSPELHKPKIAILASDDRKTGGGGSTADKVTRDTLEGKVGFEIGVVICNNEPGSVGVYPRFEAINSDFGLTGDKRIDVLHIGPQNYPKGQQDRGQTLSESAAICRTLEERDIQLVAALGYMRIITGELCEQWGWHPKYGAQDSTHNGIYHPKARILNNHPGILPFTADTSGPKTHQKAVKLFQQGRLRYTAITYHLVSAGVDTGPIFHQELVEIHSSDDANSLSERVQAVEKDLSAPILEKHLILRAEHLRGNS